MKTIAFVVPPSKAKLIMEDAMAIADSIVVDQLDCSVSLMRQSTNHSPVEILSMALLNRGNTMWHFIIRESDAERYADIGCITGNRPEYFLWIRLDIDLALALAEKYKLKLLK